MSRIFGFLVLLALLFGVPGLAATSQAAPLAQDDCRYFAETKFNVCDDGQAAFLSTFEDYGLQNVGYPVSRRYAQDGFVMQAFQKAIFQWRPDSGSVAFSNIFDDLNRTGYDEVLLRVRQTPNQFPAGWDEEGQSFEEIVETRQALLDARPELRRTYFSVSDPLLFFGLPTSEIEDMGNHYAIRLQRAVLQEWKEDVPWASAGEVTIANGGDIAKELDALPAASVVVETGPPAPPTAPPPPQAPPTPPSTPPPPSMGQVQITTIFYDGVVYRVESDEYAEIKNTGGGAVNLAGWRLNAGDAGQTFTFPSYTLQPGQSCRVYTNEHHPESCGFSFGRGSAIWNNDGDCGYLYDASGREVHRRCY